MEVYKRGCLSQNKDTIRNMTAQIFSRKSRMVKLNVGGKVFLVLKSTLNRYPDSRLAKLNEQSESFSVESGGHFFDRNPVVFGSILEAYRTGELHVPRDVCGSLMKRELEFWEISPACLSPCCWKPYYRAEADLRTTAALSTFLKVNNSIEQMRRGNAALRTRLWLFLEEPKSSKFAMVWAIFMTLTVIAATFVLTSENATGFLVGPSEVRERQIINTRLTGRNISSDRYVKYVYKDTNCALKIAEIICYCFITTDITLRLVVCPSLCTYMMSPIHICEIIALVGDWLDLWIDSSQEDFESDTWYYLRYAVKFLLIFQSVRLFRIARHIMAFNIMSLSVASSFTEIGVLLSLLLILTTVFGWLMYLAEMSNDRFESMFAAMYWALITLTTVGYGDLFPDTIFGHVVACTCAICGIVILALPIGVIAANFNTYYNHHKYVIKHITSQRDDKGIVVDFPENVSTKARLLSRPNKQSD